MIGGGCKREGNGMNAESGGAEERRRKTAGKWNGTEGREDRRG